MTLADRIAIMKDGVIQQLADPNTIYSKPSNKYVADFIGSPSMNFFNGPVKDNHFQIGDSAFALTDYHFDQAFNGNAWFGIRPEHVRSGDAASACDFNERVNVDLVEPMGSDTLVWTEIGAKPFRFRVEGQSDLKTGDQVTVGFNVSQASLFDEATEVRL